MKKLLAIAAISTLLSIGIVSQASAARLVVAAKPHNSKVVIVKPAHRNQNKVWVAGYWKYKPAHHSKVWIPGHWKWV